MIIIIVIIIILYSILPMPVFLRVNTIFIKGFGTHSIKPCIRLVCRSAAVLPPPVHYYPCQAGARNLLFWVVWNRFKNNNFDDVTSCTENERYDERGYVVVVVVERDGPIASARSGIPGVRGWGEYVDFHRRKLWRRFFSGVTEKEIFAQTDRRWPY